MSRVRVKICGITRAEDAALAARLGADAVGFVLWEGSPRRVAINAAAILARDLPPFVTRVGVVVNTTPAEMDRIVRCVGLDVVQLHGDEATTSYDMVPARIVKAVTLESDDDVARVIAMPAHVTVLVDAVDRQARGGTGRLANWSRAAEVARMRRVVLAGGLTPANVADAIAQVQPWAVDVSSGIETSPGVKSPGLMEQFFAAVRTSGIGN